MENRATLIVLVAAVAACQASRAGMLKMTSQQLVNEMTRHRTQAGVYYSANYMTELRNVYVDHFGTSWSKQHQFDVRFGHYRIGMSKQHVLAVMGRPFDINRSVGSWGVHEQWVYGKIGGPYLYFENGKLTSFQS